MQQDKGLSQLGQTVGEQQDGTCSELGCWSQC